MPDLDAAKGTLLAELRQHSLILGEVTLSSGATAQTIGRIPELGLEVVGVVDRLAGAAAKIEAAARAPDRALLTIDEIYPDRPDRD